MLNARRIGLAVAASAMMLWVSPLDAQRVTGRVLDSGTGEPLPHTVVTLLDGAGRALASGITGGDGLFRLVAPDSGSYRVRAERVGFETATSQAVRVAGQGAGGVVLLMSAQAVSLEAINVTSERTCSVHSRASDILRVWTEARKAFQAVAATEARRTLLFTGQTIQRRVDADGVVLRQQARPFTMRVAQPYRTLPAADLVERGYIHREGVDYIFFGPTPASLLSPEFERSHCFGLRRSDDGTRTGVTFVPARGASSVPGIAGTVWLETRSGRLDFVEYGYVNADAVPFASAASGRVEFSVLPDGASIVSRWWIRTAARASRATLGSRMAGTRVTEFDETGAEVHHAADGARQWALLEYGTVTGTVWDSTRAVPLQGARVVLAGTGLYTTTDAQGRFELGGLPAGSYAVQLAHPRIDSLPAYPAEAVPVEVRSGAIVNAALAVRPITSSTLGECLRRMQIGSNEAWSAADLNRSAAYGHVIDAAGVRQPDANILMSWDSLGLSEIEAVIAPRVRSISTDGRGRFAECRLPTERLIAVNIVTDAGARGSATVRLPEGASFHEFVVQRSDPPVPAYLVFERALRAIRDR